MNKLLSFLKRYALTIWLVVAALALTGIVSYAAYTSTHTAKSVIATRKGSGVPFSSNYLEVGAADKYAVSINSDSTDPTINVTVCNYPQDNPAKFHSEDIEYILTATLVNASGEAYTSDTFPTGDLPNNYYIVYNGVTYTFEESLSQIRFPQDTGEYMKLPAYNQSTHTYSLHYPQSQFENKNVFIKLEAVPKSSKDGISTLSRYLGVTPKKTVDSITGWTGGFSDDAVHEPYEYDGFNYLISGSGKANVTLSWDTNYVNINKWFLEELSISNAVTTNDNINSVTFEVDSSVTNSYTIQFYRTCEASQEEAWDFVLGKQLLVIGENKTPVVTFSSSPINSTE